MLTMRATPPSRGQLIELIGQNILVAGARPDLLATIADCLQFISVDQSTLIFRQGEEANGLYLVMQGTVQIFSEHDSHRVIMSHSSKGHLFGEFLLCGNSMRSTSALALTGCNLLFWPIETFSTLLLQQPEDFTPITTRLVRRLGWNQTMLALRLSSLFIGLNEQIVRDLINQLTIKPIPANTLLLKQYDPAEYMCIVINGQFQISKEGENHQAEIINVIGRGETVGEMGLLSGSKRTATVIALRDSTVAFLNRNAFEHLLKQHPLEINQTFVRSLINHLEKKSHVKTNTANTFALINLSPQLDAFEFSQYLLNGLQNHGLARVLTSAIIDQAFMRQGAAQCKFSNQDNASLVQWLSEQELVHEYIVYLADAQLNPWTRRCLRQADHVVFLVAADDPPEIRILETQLLAELNDNSVKKTLVLQHPKSAPTPIGTSRWLKLRQLDSHYHVRRDQRSDFDRLARFLTGNALGLVLGGGAARGFAHVGVLKALKERGISVDIVGGNSMGAVLAAEFALQWHEKRMLEKTRQLCIQGDRMTLPLVSLFSGKTMTTALEKLFGDIYIEDLWIPFFCVSCNISRATLMTHRQGTLLAALLSSNAPPGLFPPQVSDGDLLVDGALLNNLPVDIMRELNPGGGIIAVDVNEREDLLNNTDSLGGISGWQLLWNRLNPLAPRINMPGMVQILTRASMIGGLAQQKKMREGLADLYLRPPVNSFPLTGYHQAQAISDAGYEYAREQLQKWQPQPSNNSIHTLRHLQTALDHLTEDGQVTATKHSAM
ncbi:MAG: patatin-like phospholipase domain-containing protein [Methylomonas sp.]|jgi:NTE family protein/lysophospholipid hydrolase|uniref:cyclic nucleotide-binding and patatin-like phospholipase domain-containing protein n=1 Tax=Methylomonas sp. TaxID=418 RepID=UPI0025E7EA8D|nr:cyclic nucleotide-binding and patatin-like phospholipase domain-containing protein [Methylomonas sp.]MCK9604956.1 patatin-like phospholipase domain-containing protein [Methylomonas sp.]